MISFWNNSANKALISFNYNSFNNVHAAPHINYPAEFLIVFNGCVNVKISNNSYDVKDNEVILIKSLYPHEFKTTSKTSSGIIIEFAPLLHEDFFSLVKDSKFEREITKLSFSHINYIREFLAKRDLRNSDNSDDIKTILRSITSEILLNNRLITQKQPNDFLAIKNAIEYVTDHFNEDIHLPDLAKKLGINQNYASQIFPKYIGITFSEFLNKIRINHAAKLLKTTTYSIANIAFACGYNSLCTFNRIYKKYMNVTPSQFRKDNSLKNLRDDRIVLFE